MRWHLGVRMCLIFLIMTACTAEPLPAYDVSELRANVRATAQIIIQETQIAEREASTALQTTNTHLERVNMADVSNGEILFTTFQSDAGFACSTCHWVDTENQLIGPGLLNISTRAITRDENQDALDYIFTSIVMPDAYVVEPFSADLMPENWSEIYTEDELYDIVAYLTTLSDTTADIESQTDVSASDGSEPLEIADADSSNGEILFTTFQPDAGFACSTCHWVDNDNQLIGPGLLTIRDRATARVSGQSPYEYILTSIVMPDAYIVEPFSADLMPENWSHIYTENEINDIISYLWQLND